MTEGLAEVWKFEIGKRNSISLLPRPLIPSDLVESFDTELMTEGLVAGHKGRREFFICEIFSLRLCDFA